MKRAWGFIKNIMTFTFWVSPKGAVGTWIINIINSVIMTAQIVVLQRLFDSIAGYERKNLLFSFILFAGVMVLEQVMNGILNLDIERKSYIMTEKLFWRMNRKVSAFPPEFFDREENLDLLQRARDGAEGVTYVFNVVSLLITEYIPYFVFMGIYLGRNNAILVIVLPLVFIPVVLSEFLRSRRFEAAEERCASMKRRYHYYSDCLNSLDYAGETRILRAQKFFFSKLLETVKAYNHVKTKAVRSANHHEIRMKGITLSGYIACIFILVWSVVRGNISAGAFAAVFASLNTMFQFTENMISRHIGSIVECKPNIACYLKVMSMSEIAEDNSGLQTETEKIFRDNSGLQAETKKIFRDNSGLQAETEKISGNDSSIHAEKKAESCSRAGLQIEMRDVSFVYPGKDRAALEHINIRIHPGEMIAVVGENGAGKSTFAKLLMGLYGPSAGIVLYEGKDVRDRKRENLNKIQECGSHLSSDISAVMQDFGRYSMTVNENIAFCQAPSEEKTDRILEEVGMMAAVMKLENGKNTVLSRKLGGVDLSGGQWQRLAIARGYYKDADFLVLDEPTSAIDPKFEGEICHLFQKIAQNKTTIIITHRLAMARGADRIIFLENGHIEEIGTHEALMKKNGKYAYMYTLQKSSYDI